MGERVVVNPSAAGAGARGGGAGPTPVVPLEYGHGSRTGDARRRFFAAVAERFRGAARFAGMMIALIGGPRQFAFAIGLMFLAGGVADAISGGNDDAIIAMSIGGLLIGLAVPVPKRKV